MRFLNKITFINSATIKYAEVYIDGNVHFIGTQGVGKSTLLRSILYFYNADSLKLGISKEKKSFAEYYFPFQNSYLVYEVTTETGNYSIVAFKSQGKVCFRFIDTAYDKKYFIATDGKAFETWDATRSLLDAAKIYYTKKIDRYEEYRDILYGNNDTKKDFKKYALLESKQYQNIPRTIQNVFLNSKLDAEFIKQTIIMSLNEEDIEIDLNSYTHHLKDFESQLKDIQLFKESHVLKQAENVIKLHTAIRHLEREKIQYSLQLAYSVQQVQRLEPKLFDKKEREENNKETLLQKIEESEKRFQNKIQKLRGEITVLDDKLKTIKEKKEYYDNKKIEETEQRVAKKLDVEAALNKLKKEKEVLSFQFKELNQKYELLFQHEERSLKDFEQAKNTEKLQLKETFYQHKNELKEQLEQLKEDIKDNNKQAIVQAQQAIEDAQKEVHHCYIKKEAIKHQRFFEDELIAAKDSLSSLQITIQQSSNEVQAFKNKYDTLLKQLSFDEGTLQQQTERSIEKLNEAIVQQQQQVQFIEAKINNSKDSLYGWLNQHEPGWENTIGKVIQEEVLFLNDLSPQKTTEKTNTLYGIQINLNELSSKVKTVADYTKEKTNLLADVEKKQQQIQAHQQKLTEELDKLKRKYQPKIKEYKEGINEHTYIVEQSETKLAHAKLLIKDIEINAQNEQQQALQQINDLIDAATEKHLEAKQFLQSIEDGLQKQLKAKEKEHDKKLNVEEETLKTRLQFIENDVVTYHKNYEKQIQKLNKQQQAELAGEGANTEQLTVLENDITQLQKELNFIEKNRDLVTEYKKDKRELLDKADSFKNEKSVLEQ
ncbi:MAG: ATP-binding protein, partial [Chitinophagaceae bacterium]|nr:ATP-binding protein [Chitinophagaceae bacterium]